MIRSFTSARRLSLLALIATACNPEVTAPPVGAGSGAPSPELASPARAVMIPAAARLNQWRALARPGRPVWTSSNPDGTLRAASGLQLIFPETDPSRLSQRFRETAGDLLALDATSDLHLERDRRDPSGRRHLSLSQRYQGLPVHNAVLLITLDGDRLTSFSSSLIRLDQVDLSSNVPAGDAARRLERDLGLQADATLARAEIYPLTHGKGERAWRFIGDPLPGAGALVPGAPGGTGGQVAPGGTGGLVGAFSPAEVVVSAVDGRILSRVDLAMSATDVAPCQNSAQLGCTARTTGTGEDGQSYDLELFRGTTFALPALLDGYYHPYSIGTYPDLYGPSTSTDTFFVDLAHASTLGGIYVVHSDGSIKSGSAVFDFDSNDYITFGAGPTFDNKADYGSSVSTLASIRHSLAFYQEKFGRVGLSGNPAAPIDVLARVDLQGLNAIWVPEHNYMLMGTFGGTSLAIAQDVTGHELTHAMIYVSSSLGFLDQPGALNEALADIYGTLIQADANGTLDWWIGEDIPLLVPLRSLKYPHLYHHPGHMSEYVVTSSDSGGVHTNMSIVTKAFQLAAEGTPAGEPYFGFEVTPADKDLMASALLLGRVGYHVMDYSLTPTTGFADFAVMMLGAADDAGLTSAQSAGAYDALRDAFLATGILTNAENAPLSVLGGIVTNTSTGKPVAGAAMTLAWTGASAQTSTDAAGNYRFTVDQRATLSATLSGAADGYYSSSKTVSLTSVETAAQSQVQSDLKLAPRPPASLKYTPPTQPIQIKLGSSAAVSLKLSNGGTAESQLAYKLRPTVSFSWKEISFAWEDISLISSPISLTGDQEHSSEMQLYTPFPYYFDNYQSLYISTDGYVTLSPDSSIYYQQAPIPSTAAPRSLIAPYWTDLNFGNTPRAYYYYDSSRGQTYVQYQQVPDFLREYAYTFQMVLFPDGRIHFYYHDIPGTADSWARVGLQDPYGGEGLQVAFNTPEADSGVPRTEYALELTPSMPPYKGAVTLGQSSGSLFGGASATIPVTIVTTNLAKGSYSFKIRIDSNDPVQPTVQVLVPFTVI